MKKSSGAMTIFVIIVLLGLGGAVFFFGWAHQAVPVGSYGVLRTKTHGIDPEIIREGEFRWVWYKLIPANAVISVYSPKRVERSFLISGSLSQAELYGGFASSGADFSYRLDGSFAFRVDPESLPALTESRGIAGQEDLERLETLLAAEIEAFMGRRVNEYLEESETLPGAAFAERLKQEISTAFPGVNVLDVTMDMAEVPDFALYNSLRLIYEAYLESQQQSLMEAVREAAVRDVSARFRLDELAKYGELLTKYPILLEYLNIENGVSR
jgi:hypothetical protein